MIAELQISADKNPVCPILCGLITTMTVNNILWYKADRSLFPRAVGRFSAIALDLLSASICLGTSDRHPAA